MQFINRILLVLIFGAMAGCSTAARPDHWAEPEVFRVGEVEVRLYQTRERMVRHLPPLFALLEATKVGHQQIQVSGYFDPQTKTIYAINDAKTVIHEFKHYLEPQWKHEHGSTPRVDGQTQISNRVALPSRASTVGAQTAADF